VCTSDLYVFTCACLSLPKCLCMCLMSICTLIKIWSHSAVYVYVGMNSTQASVHAFLCVYVHVWRYMSVWICVHVLIVYLYLGVCGNMPVHGLSVCFQCVSSTWHIFKPHLFLREDVHPGFSLCMGVHPSTWLCSFMLLCLLMWRNISLCLRLRICLCTCVAMCQCVFLKYLSKTHYSWKSWKI
jgi:hypothetical protein